MDIDSINNPSIIMAFIIKASIVVVMDIDYILKTLHNPIVVDLCFSY